MNLKDFICFKPNLTALPQTNPQLLINSIYSKFKIVLLPKSKPPGIVLPFQIPIPPPHKLHPQFLTYSPRWLLLGNLITELSQQILKPPEDLLGRLIVMIVLRPQLDRRTVRAIGTRFLIELPAGGIQRDGVGGPCQVVEGAGDWAQHSAVWGGLTA